MKRAKLHNVHTYHSARSIEKPIKIQIESVEKIRLESQRCGRSVCVYIRVGRQKKVHLPHQIRKAHLEKKKCRYFFYFFE